MKTSSSKLLGQTCLNTSPDPAEPQDDFLMQRIQQKDAHALDLLFQRYRALLKSVILRVVHDHATADDVAQECMLEIWQNAAHYCPEKGKALGWLVTLGKRRAIDHVRRRQAYNHARERMQCQAQITRWSAVAATDCELADLGQVLGQHLNRLPAQQQQVIRLGYLKGMSQREIALNTQTPLGTVKTRMELGLKKLRHAFRAARNFHAVRPQHSI